MAEWSRPSKIQQLVFASRVLVRGQFLLGLGFAAVCTCSNIRAVQTGFVVTDHGALDVFGSQVELLLNLKQSKKSCRRT